VTLASDRNAMKLRQETSRALAAGDRIEEYGMRRTCDVATCTAQLSRYNPATTCSLHRGWVSTRTRSSRD